MKCYLWERMFMYTPPFNNFKISIKFIWKESIKRISVYLWWIILFFIVVQIWHLRDLFCFIEKHWISCMIWIKTFTLILTTFFLGMVCCASLFLWFLLYQFITLGTIKAFYDLYPRWEERAILVNVNVFVEQYFSFYIVFFIYM